MAKVARSDALELVGMAGIDPELRRPAHARGGRGARRRTTGLADLLERGRRDRPRLRRDVGARARRARARCSPSAASAAIDLTPAALGPAVVPSVNLGAHADAPDVNLITCGAQATVPIVAALAASADVRYAEIVSTISSRSAGPGTRQNIDEFTQATARGARDGRRRRSAARRSSSSTRPTRRS